MDGGLHAGSGSLGDMNDGSFLEAHYESAGLLDCAPIKNSLVTWLIHGGSVDEFWEVTDSELQRARAGMPHPHDRVFGSPDDMIRLNENLDRVCQPAEVLDRFLRIADSVIERVAEGYGHKEVNHAQALEATLWRAFDALKSIAVLRREGLVNAIEGEIRAAQEALLLHQWFTRSKKKAHDFRVRSYWNEAIQMVEATRFNQERFGHSDPRVDAQGRQRISELKALGVVAAIVDGELQTKSNLPKCEPRWQDLVKDPNLEAVFGDEQYRYYLDGFLRGNRSLHCLATGWDRYVAIEGGKLELKGMAAGKPVRIPMITYVPMLEFARALKVARPSFRDVYVNWLVCCAGRNLENPDETDQS